MLGPQTVSDKVNGTNLMIFCDYYWRRVLGVMGIFMVPLLLALVVDYALMPTGDTLAA